jgi:tellurite resistance protein TehA-like permease
VHKSSVAQLLFASATVLLSVAYAFGLHAEAAKAAYSNFSSLVTILFVPAIVSAVSLLEYNRSHKRVFLHVGLTFLAIAFLVNFLYIYFVFIMTRGGDSKLNTSVSQLVYMAPLCYLILLILSSLPLKRQKQV